MTITPRAEDASKTEGIVIDVHDRLTPSRLPSATMRLLPLSAVLVTLLPSVGVHAQPADTTTTCKEGTSAGDALPA
jgi:hypothetical protein